MCSSRHSGLFFFLVVLLMFLQARSSLADARPLVFFHAQVMQIASEPGEPSDFREGRVWKSGMEKRTYSARLSCRRRVCVCARDSYEIGALLYHLQDARNDNHPDEYLDDCWR